MSIHTSKGPLVGIVKTREDAIQKLREQPGFPKVADNELDVFEVNGQWVAAWHVPDEGWPRTAEFPPGDSEEESPPPKANDNGGGEEGSAPPAPKDDGGESDSDSDGPPKKEHSDGDKGGTEHKILALLEVITQALGLGPAGGEGLPGEEVPGGPAGGPPPPPPGPGGPPHHPGGGQPSQIIQHQRSLKPGEAQPGQVPIGAPAFASVKEHPWEALVGQKASFIVSERIPEDLDLTPIDQELNHLAYETRSIAEERGVQPFKVKQLTAGYDTDGHRIARALISAY